MDIITDFTDVVSSFITSIIDLIFGFVGTLLNDLLGIDIDVPHE